VAHAARTVNATGVLRPAAEVLLLRLLLLHPIRLLLLLLTLVQLVAAVRMATAVRVHMSMSVSLRMSVRMRIFLLVFQCSLLRVGRPGRGGLGRVGQVAGTGHRKLLLQLRLRRLRVRHLSHLV